jgi:hypothetical protein
MLVVQVGGLLRALFTMGCLAHPALQHRDYKAFGLVKLGQGNFKSLHYLPIYAGDTGSALDWRAFSSVVCSRRALTRVINELVSYSAQDYLEATWRKSVFVRSTVETDKFRVGMTLSLGWNRGVVADMLRRSGLGGGGGDMAWLEYSGDLLDGLRGEEEHARLHVLPILSRSRICFPKNNSLSVRKVCCYQKSLG